MDKIANEAEEKAAFTLKHTKSVSYTASGSVGKRECVSRQELFRDIQEQTRMRRSKYLSNDELKSSFKKTNLE